MLSACNRSSERAGVEMASEAVAAPMADRDVKAPERKQIKTGYIEFETNPMNSAREHIFQTIDTYKAYISSAREYTCIPDRLHLEKNFKNGFRNGWNTLIWFFVLLTNLWPFILFMRALL